jgi:S-DNA-T family DNA segregation ATPase FtsK/SpoIIIE
LGELGAWISHAFVRKGFGYFSLILTVLGGVYGWFLFRLKSLEKLYKPTFMSLYLMMLISTISAYLAPFFLSNETQVFTLSGGVGISLNQLLSQYLGILGTPIIYVIIVVVTLLLTVDWDVQKRVDALKKKMDERALRATKLRNEKTISASKPQSQPQATEITPKRKLVVPKASKLDDILDEIELISPEESITPPEDVAKEQQEQINQIVRAESIPAITPPLDQAPNPKPPSKPPSKAEELEIQVFVGQKEEEANQDALGRRGNYPNLDQAYHFPTLDLLDVPKESENSIDYNEIEANKKIIEEKLGLHGIKIKSIHAIIGPTVTLYELLPDEQVKISRIESFADDLKMAMAVHGLRILAPIPGKNLVGIEVPNKKRQIVYTTSVINTKTFAETDMDLPVAFGMTIENEVFLIDLTKMPHLLIAGATGSGKSVGINTILTCLLFRCHPETLKFVLIDPKKIELSLYQHIQHKFIATLPHFEEPIITDTSKVLEILQSVCKEMDDRYELLKMAMVRDLKAYNNKFKSGVLEEDLGHKFLPYIVVIIDELADLMITAGRQIEEPIARIAQLARAVGIHLVVATQRPSVNVITGTIKANFPARIAYKVASKVDSRTILDTMGADQLVGRGDMLFSAGGPMVRIQNAFVSTEEVERITAFIGNQKGPELKYMLPVIEELNDNGGGANTIDELDALFEEAAKVVVMHQQGSVSLLQRKLKVGYGRAGRLIDQLFTAEIVGKYQGSAARQVLIKDEEELEQHLRNMKNE